MDSPPTNIKRTRKPIVSKRIDEIREENDKMLSVMNQKKKPNKLIGKKLHPLDHNLSIQPKDKTIVKLGNSTVSRYLVP